MSTFKNFFTFLRILTASISGVNIEPVENTKTRQSLSSGLIQMLYRHLIVYF